MSAPKVHWTERVRDTEKFHKQCIRENEKHRIEDTAVLLNRSHGSVNEDLLIASWLKTHPKIQECKTMNEALRLIRKRKREMRMN